MKKFGNRLIAVLLAAALVLPIAACNTEGDEVETTTTPITTVAGTETEETTEATEAVETSEETEVPEETETSEETTEDTNGGADDRSALTPGTYTVTADGYGGEFEIDVEVTADAIVSITIGDNSETLNLGTTAIESVSEDIVDLQTLALDSISGATISSDAILDAVKDAIIEAGGNPDEWMTAAEEGDAVDHPKIEKEADVVIIGAGGAGLMAAVEVLRADGTVIVIEKEAAVGGNTLRAGSAMNSSNPELQGAETMSESEKETVEELLALEAKNETMAEWQQTMQAEWEAYLDSGATYLFDSPSLHKLQTYVGGDYVADPFLVDLLGENALPAVKQMEELGTNWQNTINAAVGATWRRSHTPTVEDGTGGTQFVLPQYDFVTENGGEVLLESKAEELIIEDGVCVGVKGQTADGQEFEVRGAKGVIIATGGFGANVEMREAYNTIWPYIGEDLATSNGPFAQGEGIVMAEAVGAQLTGMEHIQILPTWGQGIITTYIENQIYVNKEGERIVREDGRRDVLSAAILEQTDAAIYIVNDSRLVGEDGLSVTGIDVNAKVERGDVLMGETVEELAEQIGCDPEVLQASIDEFNNSVENGQDPFGRTVFDEKIEEGPFYAGIATPAVHHTMGGIRINTECQVLDANDEPIPGLFAAGEVTGGIHGGNRLGGNAITDVAVFGRIAGRSIMGVVDGE